MDGDRATIAGAVRLVAAITLVTVVLFYPIHAYYTDAGAASLRPVYVLHVVVAGLVLAATFTRLAQWAGALSVVFVLGLTANVLLYVYLVPYGIPTYPSLSANALTCLLIAGAVMFAWSPWQTLAVGLAGGAGFALVGLLVSTQGHPGTPFWITGCWLAIGTGLAVGCAHALGRFRATLLERHRELTALSDRLMTVQEEQLRGLSRELHDELGQSLTAVSSYLWLVEQQLPSQLMTLRARTAEARRVVARTLGQMRELSQLLRPPVLDLYGLVPSLEEHLRKFEQRHEIATSFQARDMPERLAPEAETAIYRITQEALTNVARHAHATSVRVCLHADAARVHLDVEDDGDGLPSHAASRSGVGLIGIRERVRALGGTMTLASDHGVRLAVHLPLDASPGAEAGRTSAQGYV